MSVLTVYDDLFLSIVFLLILLFDTFLQAKYYRTGRIDNFNIIFVSCYISFGRLTMSAKQYFCVVQLLELFMIDGDESH